MSLELERHEKYKEISRFMYHYDPKNCPKGVILLYKSENPDTGFFGCSFKYKDRIVVAYRGTNFKEKCDVINDANMFVLNNIPKQVKDALRFIDQMKVIMKKKYPGYKLDVTGHSLGGSLAQYSSVFRYVNETVTFQPYGVGNTLDSYFTLYNSKSPLNTITNYMNEKDRITGTKSEYKQIGKTYLIESNVNFLENINPFIHHSLEKMKPLSTRKPAPEKYQYHHPYWLNDAKGHNSSECVGTYSVSGYTRSDGTKVDGYTRTCGAKHAGKEKYAGRKFQDIPPDELEDAISYFI